MKFLTLGAAALLLVSSCTSSQKTMPHLGVGAVSLEAEIARDNIVVLNSVEGSSKTTSILGGLIQIIDDDKMKILGFSLGFTDKYTYFQQPSLTGNPIGYVLGLIGGPTTADRAYYKALEANPDADIVLEKSMDQEVSGLGFIYSNHQVTFRGKALQIKTD